MFSHCDFILLPQICILFLLISAYSNPSFFIFTRADFSSSLATCFLNFFLYDLSKNRLFDIQHDISSFSEKFNENFYFDTFAPKTVPSPFFKIFFLERSGKMIGGGGGNMSCTKLPIIILVQIRGCLNIQPPWAGSARAMECPGRISMTSNASSSYSSMETVSSRRMKSSRRGSKLKWKSGFRFRWEISKFSWNPSRTAISLTILGVPFLWFVFSDCAPRWWTRSEK